MGMNTIIEELDRSSKTIAPEKLQEVIKKIKEHKRIFVYGTGRSCSYNKKTVFTKCAYIE